MRHMTILAAIALGAGPAMAGNVQPAPQDPVIASPVVQRAATGGDWTGPYAGAQLGYGNVDASGAANADGDGVTGGVHAGYNHDFGNFVLGGEIDHDVTDINLSGGAGSLDNVTRLKLRGGYDLGRTLVYGTAGPAFANADIGGSLSDTGYFAGIGVERMVTDNISVGGEALYHQFDNFDGSNVDLEATTLSARVSFHF